MGLMQTKVLLKNPRNPSLATRRGRDARGYGMGLVGLRRTFKSSLDLEEIEKKEVLADGRKKSPIELRFKNRVGFYCVCRRSGAFRRHSHDLVLIPKTTSQSENPNEVIYRGN